MRKQEVPKSPAAGWQVWINSISIARHFRPERDLQLSRIQAALFPIFLGYLWALFSCVLCAAAFWGGSGGTGELPAWVSTGTQEPAAIRHHSTSSATPRELLGCLKKPYPRSLLQVFLCLSVYNSKGYCEDIVRWGELWPALSGSRTVLVWYRLKNKSACSETAKGAPGCCSLA